MEIILKIWRSESNEKKKKKARKMQKCNSMGGKVENARTAIIWESQISEIVTISPTFLNQFF